MTSGNCSECGKRYPRPLATSIGGVVRERICWDCFDKHVCAHVHERFPYKNEAESGIFAVSNKTRVERIMQSLEETTVALVTKKWKK